MTFFERPNDREKRDPQHSEGNGEASVDRTSTNSAGILAVCGSPIDNANRYLGVQKAFFASPCGKTPSGPLRTEGANSNSSSGGNKQKPSTIRRFLSRLTGESTEVIEEEDYLIHLAETARRKSEQLAVSKGTIVEDIFPNRR